MIEASIVISYIDSEATLPILLDILERQDYPREKFEIVLINGDDYHPRLNQAEGQILGIKEAKGKVIFLIDSDRFCPFNWISSHMKYYPRYDLVAGQVLGHLATSVQSLSFGNVSMKREVFETIPINNLVSQQDCDFAFRFIRSKFKGIAIKEATVWEPPEREWNSKHYYLMARNIMVLRKKYRILPELSSFGTGYSLKHPAAPVGMLAGLFCNQIVNAHV